MRPALAALPLLVSMLAGCGSVHVYIPDGSDNPPMDQERVSHLRAPHAIRLINGYAQYPPESTKQFPQKWGTLWWVVDHKKLTDAGIAMLRVPMEKHGIAIDRSAEKTLTLAVRQARGGYVWPTPLALSSHASAQVELEARLGDGSVLALWGSHSDASTHRAFVGALRNAIEEVLADEKFVAYLNQ